jgi:4-methyl-5(b-hydroxyethyl)-thiazole monophosphate biosynthesis
MLKDNNLMLLLCQAVNIFYLHREIIILSFCYLGNKGTEKIASCKKSGALLLDHYKTNKLVAAICAGPVAVSTHLYDADENARKHDITCYPDSAKSLQNKFKSINLNVPVVDSEVNNRHIITSQGPATAIEFGLKILSRLTDEKTAEEIRKKVLA